MSIGLLLLTGAAGVLAAPSFAAPKSTTSPVDPSVTTHVWYDGDHERRLSENPGLVAEFRGNTVPGAVQRVFPDAVAIPKGRGPIQIWRLAAGTRAAAAIPKLKAANQAARYSAVFHDGKTTRGRMRALPGNIIVYFNPAWDRAAIDAWTGKRNLAILRQLDIGPNIFVLQTEPGLASLETANAIYKSGQVVAAFPDWWEEVATR